MFSNMMRAAALLLAASTLTQASPIGKIEELSARATGSRPDKKLVYAHFMVGVTAFYEVSDFTNDMNAARKVGIDAFALNIGTDSYTTKVLDNAYAAAATFTDFKVFISFDFNWFALSNPGTVTNVTQLLDTYCGKPGQQMVNGKCFSGSFSGDGFDYNTIRKTSKFTAGHYFCPNWHDGAISTGISSGNIDCVHNWMGWANNNNRGVNYSLTPEADLSQIAAVGTDHGYMAGVSPWFFTHFGPFVSFSKNWVFKAEEVYLSRWQQMLNLERQPDFIEIETWNDYGESHYVGPINTRHSDDGSEGWTKGFPHDALLVLAQPYIAAFKSGAKQPTVTDESIVSWYRPTPKTAVATGEKSFQYQGKDMYPNQPPEGWELLEDVIFVTTMLKTPGTLVVSSGCNSIQVDVPAGVTLQKVPMGIGKQSFSLLRDGKAVMQGTAPMQISATLELYNFNIYSCWVDSKGVHEYSDYEYDTTTNNIVSIQGTAGPAPQAFNGVTRTIADNQVLSQVSNTMTGVAAACTASGTATLASAPVFTPTFTKADGSIVSPTWAGYSQAAFVAVNNAAAAPTSVMASSVAASAASTSLTSTMAGAPAVTSAVTSPIVLNAASAAASSSAASPSAASPSAASPSSTTTKTCKNKKRKRSQS